eukprot:12907949-Prorocentrum_lima.AAC.1
MDMRLSTAESVASVGICTNWRRPCPVTLIWTAGCPGSLWLEARGCSAPEKAGAASDRIVEASAVSPTP